MICTYQRTGQEFINVRITVDTTKLHIYLYISILLSSMFTYYFTYDPSNIIYVLICFLILVYSSIVCRVTCTIQPKECKIKSITSDFFSVMNQILLISIIVVGIYTIVSIFLIYSENHIYQFIGIAMVIIEIILLKKPLITNYSFTKICEKL